MKIFLMPFFIASAFFAQPSAYAVTTKENTHDRNPRPSSFVSAIEKPSLEANINQGDVAIGGFFSLGESWHSNFNIFNLDLSVPVQYFIANKIAFGGEIDIFHSSGSGVRDTTDAFMGPKATVFFWNDGKWTSYFGSSLLFQFLDRSSDSILWSNNLGLNYFATPSVAFGPSLQYAHGFGLDHGDSFNRLGILLGFSVFL